MLTILHVDMDSFFASCEQQAKPHLRGVPIAVSGDPKSRTVVAAASKEAKKFGVKSAMTIGEARALCPQIQFVLGDPDKYVEVSRRVIGILEDFTPDVEVTSIDEAFLDVTGWVTSPSPTSPLGFRGTSRSPSWPEGEKNSLHGGAVYLAQEIKRRIREEVGEWITCSIGIASNKRLAKLASEFDKPDGIVIVTDDHGSLRMATDDTDVHPHSLPLPVEGREKKRGCGGRLRILSRAELLASLKLRDLCGIGARIEARLQRLGIMTVCGLAATPLDLLVEEFGSYGYELHDMAMGHDASPVDAEDHEPKSMGHATTLPKDLRTIEEIRPIVEELSEKVAARLRRHGYRGSTIHIVLRFRDFTSRGEQTTIPDATDDGLRMSREAMRILQGFLPLPMGGGATCPDRSIGRGGGEFPKPVRLIGVSVGKLVRANPKQASLFPKDQRWQAAIVALDAANDRYGDWTVQRASLLRAERVLRKVAAAFRATAHLSNPFQPPLTPRGGDETVPRLG